MSSLILRTMAPLLSALLLLFSAFFLLRGHDDPGGGFIGGLLAVGALVTRVLVHGAADVRRLLRVRPLAIAGAGLAAAAASGIAGWLTSEGFFVPVWAPMPPQVGQLALGTPLLFDVGVYAVVLGFGATIVLAFAEEG